MTDTLQDEFEAMAARCKATQAQLDQADQDLKTLIVSIVDADSKARPGLIVKRSDLLAARDLLRDELSELTRRRDIADLARFEYAITQAENELAKRLQTAQASRKATDETFNSMLRFQNSGRRQQNEESDQVRIKLETEKAKATAQSSIDGGYLEKAKNLLIRAKADLEEREKVLGIIPQDEPEPAIVNPLRLPMS